MHRLVLLGASNVRRGFPAIVQAAREARGPDVQVLGAFGHGRSYGARSCLALRCLPGLLECGLWSAVGNNGPAVALVTDVGNDILYGEPTPRILGWVAECLHRLSAAGAAVRLTGLPVGRLRLLRPAEFLFFRTLFFPSSRVTWREALEAAGELEEGLRSLAARSGSAFVELPEEWYGADPIHIRRSRRAPAWAEILGVPKARRTMPAGEALRLRLAAPERRWIGGVEIAKAQPALIRPGGLQVALY